MVQSCVGGVLTNLRAFDGWLGGIIQSLFPWPAIILFALLYPPLRRALDRVVVSLADSVRTLRRIKAAGVEFTLDPEAAREIRAKSTVVVRGDYERNADGEVRKYRVRDKFSRVIEDTVRPLAQHGFRSTIHIADALEAESLYQLSFLQKHRRENIERKSAISRCGS